LLEVLLVLGQQVLGVAGLVVGLIWDQVNLRAHPMIFDVPIVVLIRINQALFESQLELVQLETEDRSALITHRAKRLELAHLDATFLLAAASIFAVDDRDSPWLEVLVLACSRFQFRLDWLLAFVTIKEFSQNLDYVQCLAFSSCSCVCLACLLQHSHAAINKGLHDCSPGRWLVS
jgi:hypothetical protein